ncbi:helix-turn-helix transcriptional regulator, partial [Aurantimonas sp. C2-5-R2]
QAFNVRTRKPRSSSPTVPPGAHEPHNLRKSPVCGGGFSNKGECSEAHHNEDVAVDHWGTRLKAALQARQIGKHYALAVELGVHESAISRWLQGLAISVPHLIALCQTLDISIDWLLTGQGSMTQHKLPMADSAEAARILFQDITRRDMATTASVLAVLLERMTAIEH